MANPTVGTVASVQPDTRHVSVVGLDAAFRFGIYAEGLTAHAALSVTDVDVAAVSHLVGSWGINALIEV